MLPRWLETLLDDGARGRLAVRIDRPVDIAFTIVRNAGFVAVAQYVAERGAHPGFRLVYIALALLLMVQIASRFMLQPQIRLFRSPMSNRRRLVQGAANMALCAAACALAIYAIDLFVRGMIAFQIGPS